MRTSRSPYHSMRILSNKPDPDRKSRVSTYRRADPTFGPHGRILVRCLYASSRSMPHHQCKYAMQTAGARPRPAVQCTYTLWQDIPTNTLILTASSAVTSDLQRWRVRLRQACAFTPSRQASRCTNLQWQTRVADALLAVVHRFGHDLDGSGHDLPQAVWVEVHRLPMRDGYSADAACRRLECDAHHTVRCTICRHAAGQNGALKLRHCSTRNMKACVCAERLCSVRCVLWCHKAAVRLCCNRRRAHRDPLNSDAVRHGAPVNAVEVDVPVVEVLVLLQLQRSAQGTSPHQRSAPREPPAADVL